jgi:hypothetical protein
MKPLGPVVNNTPKSCDDITTSCVIWDGPNISIECLGVQIYQGQSINPILYNSVKNLCDILDKINMDELNITCLGDLINTSRSINDVFNIIASKLCEDNDRLSKLENDITEIYTARLPYCLQLFNDQLTITRLTLPEYYQKLAAQICLYLIDIDGLNSHLAIIQIDIDLIEQEIIALCGATTALVQPICTNNAVLNPSNDPVTVDKALAWLESSFCDFQNYIGTHPELLAAIAKDCPNLDSSQMLCNTGAMNTIYGWKTNPSTVADSINNLWLTICDLRTAIVNVQTNCCP